MKPLIIAAMVAVCLTAGPAIAQEPVHPVDIRADDVTYQFLSADLIEVTMAVTVQSSHDEDWWVESFFDVCMGTSMPVRIPMNISVTTNNCGEDPDCNDPCEVYVSSGELVWDHCNMWHTWHGAGCDPYDPSGTCIPLDYCACGAQYLVTTTLDYDGEEGDLLIALDPTDVVLEADETNNACSTPLYAPEPVEPIDLVADTILVTFLSPNMIEVAAYFTVQSSHNESQGYSSSIELLLDTNPFYSSTMSITVPYNNCGEDPDCNDPCQVEVEPGSLVWDYCSIWHTWMGPSCDPGNPSHTCMPMDYCACGSQYMLVATVSYDGEDELTFVVDGVAYVPEADETNNTCTVWLAPIAVENTTWGAVKSLFGN